MADRYTLRKYLMFQALIQRVRNPTRAVDRLLRRNPEWDERETRTWEGWRDDFIPEFNGSRPVDTAEIKEGPL